MLHAKVLLVDDHALLRQMLHERLQREPSISVVGTAANADEAIQVAREHRPDIVVTDIDMPGLSCFDAARQITAERPETRFIFLTAYSQDHYIEQALRIGAYGYLTKDEPPERVAAAVRAVARGEASFSGDIRARIVIDPQRTRLGAARQTRLSSLSTREIETLRYISRGLPMKEIASLMGVGRRTAEKHGENLMRKLDIHDRVELARFAIREGVSEA